MRAVIGQETIAADRIADVRHRAAAAAKEKGKAARFANTGIARSRWPERAGWFASGLLVGAMWMAIAVNLGVIVPHLLFAVSSVDSGGGQVVAAVPRRVGDRPAAMFVARWPATWEAGR